MEIKEYRDNSNRHLPPFLRNGTKANFVWQLKLAGLLLICLYAKDTIENRRAQLKRNAEPAESTEN